MKYRKLGSSEPDVSVIGLGTWSMGGDEWGPADDATSIEVLRTGRRRGVNLIDTADVYGLGRSEQLIAEALGDDGETLIVTKGGWDIYTDPPVVGGARRRYEPEYLRHAAEESRRRLRRSVLDVYLLHNPGAADHAEHRPIQTLRAMQEQGIVRLVGASVGSEDDARAAIEAGIDVLEVPFNVVRSWARRILADAVAAGVAILTREPLERGLLTGKYDAQATFPAGDHRGDKGREWLAAAQPYAAKVTELARSRRCTSAQAAIAYPLSYHEVSCVVLGARSVEQLNANLQAVDIELSAEDRRRLEAT